MHEQQPSSETHKHYFMSLVTMLSMSVMQQLGKLKNPATGQTEVGLEGAQATIDMLDMLEAKTRGNLEEDEEKLLKDTLKMLKLNYVETAGSERQKPAEPASEREQPAAEPEEPAEEERIKTPPEESGGKKDPKFHKSYE